MGARITATFWYRYHLGSCFRGLFLGVPGVLLHSAGFTNIDACITLRERRGRFLSNGKKKKRIVMEIKPDF